MGSSVESALNTNNFMESTKTTEQRILNAKLKDISKAIKRMDPMIVDAMMTYSENRAGFSGDRKQTASVAIQTKGGKELSSNQRRAIISFVEKSFAGLTIFAAMFVANVEMATAIIAMLTKNLLLNFPARINGSQIVSP